MASNIFIKHAFQVIDDSQPNKKPKTSSKPKAHLLAQMLRHRVGITFWKEHVPQQILLWSLTVSRRIDAFPRLSELHLQHFYQPNHFHFALRKPKSPTTNWSFQTFKKTIPVFQHLQLVPPTCRDTPPLVKSVNSFGCPTDVLPEHCQALGDEKSHQLIRYKPQKNIGVLSSGGGQKKTGVSTIYKPW